MEACNFMLKDLPALVPYIFQEILEEYPDGIHAAKLLKPKLLLEEIEFVIKLFQDNFNYLWCKRKYLTRDYCQKCGKKSKLGHNGRPVLQTQRYLYYPKDISHFGDKMPYYIASYAYDPCDHYRIYKGVLYPETTTNLQDIVELLKSLGIHTLFNSTFIRHHVGKSIWKIKNKKTELGLSCFDFLGCEHLVRNLGFLCIANIYNPPLLLSICATKCVSVFMPCVQWKELDRLNIPVSLHQMIYDIYYSRVVYMHPLLTHTNLMILDKKFVKINSALHKNELFFKGNYYNQSVF